MSRWLENFNPRTHRGVRLYRAYSYPLSFEISIHAPIVGCDILHCLKCHRFLYFNPRTHRGVRPFIDDKPYSTKDFNPRTHRGVRLFIYNYIRDVLDISIHAPIVGCDTDRLVIMLVAVYFNPRTHRGVRRSPSTICPAVILFQSTHPSWGATVDLILKGEKTIISIHAPIVGCDPSGL